MQRIIVYIDGFNLYFGMRARSWQRYYWLDLAALSNKLLQSGQQLAEVKYFTSRISDPAAKRRRQNGYLEALQVQGGVSLFFGQYQSSPRVCRACGTSTLISQEKMTDVNIAIEMLSDAFQNHFDMALLISADSDLVPPVRRIKALFPHKRIVAAFPPARRSNELSQAADAYFSIGRAALASSQLPETVTKPNGTLLSRPSHWK